LTRKGGGDPISITRPIPDSSVFELGLVQAVLRTRRVSESEAEYWIRVYANLMEIMC